MARTSHPVFKAVRRWEQKGLLTPDLSTKLKEEVEEEARREGRRWSQYFLAGTGGAILIVAGSTFLAWAWPEMGFAGQSITLCALGLFILGSGMWLPHKGRWIPVAYLLQIAGSILIIMALVYSENAWADGTPGAWGTGVLALLLPVVLIWKAVREQEVMAAIQAALAFLFLYLFFDRAFGLSMETILWILDGFLLAGLAFLGVWLRNPGSPRWVLSVFLALVLTAVILLFFSGDVIWSLEASVIYPADVWLIAVTGLLIWGLSENAPAHLRRDWYEWPLAGCVLVGVVFGFITTLEALDTGHTPAALAVAAVGCLGLWYSLPRGSKPALVTSCVALLIAAWYWGTEMSGALGAVAALLVISAILFWGATRMGRRPGTDEPTES
jgi:hypothetical protein